MEVEGAGQTRKLPSLAFLFYTINLIMILKYASCISFFKKVLSGLLLIVIYVIAQSNTWLSYIVPFIQGTLKSVSIPMLFLQRPLKAHQWSECHAHFAAPSPPHISMAISMRIFLLFIVFIQLRTKWSFLGWCWHFVLTVGIDFVWRRKENQPRFYSICMQCGIKIIFIYIYECINGSAIIIPLISNNNITACRINYAQNEHNGSKNTFLICQTDFFVQISRIILHLFGLVFKQLKF